jgi:toxin FitB
MQIILDTNVISEAMKPVPDPSMHGWLQRQPLATIYTTSVSLAELMQGISVLPDSCRKQDLQVAARRVLGLLPQRILPFDENAAIEFAEIVAERRRLGQPIGTMDAQIAAIARARGMTVATRDIRDFANTGVNIINPWV